MEFLKANWVDVLNIVCYIVTAASIITKFTKNTWDDAIISKILRILALVPKKPVV
jgi:Co/Zn/Cd efflux system component